jgi:hypothetical protein
MARHVRVWFCTETYCEWNIVEKVIYCVHVRKYVCRALFVCARIVWSADAKLGSIEFLRIMYVFYYASVTFYKIN